MPIGEHCGNEFGTRVDIVNKMPDTQQRQQREPTKRGWRSQRILRAQIFRRYQHVGRSWHRCVRGLVYLPAAADQHIAPSNRKDPATLQAEFERLSLLGVPWACAVLGYQALLRKPDGTRNVERAVSLCTGPAHSGDPYAQYILAWALVLQGDSASAATAMRKSSLQLFPPAVLDSATFFWRAKASEKDYQSVMKLLSLSDQIGHAGTSSRRCAFYRSGRFGIGRLALGYLLLPFAAAKYYLAVTLFPFSAHVFAFMERADTRFLRFIRSTS